MHGGDRLVKLANLDPFKIKKGAGHARQRVWDRRQPGDGAVRISGSGASKKGFVTEVVAHLSNALTRSVSEGYVTRLKNALIATLAILSSHAWAGPKADRVMDVMVAALQFRDRAHECVGPGKPKCMVEGKELSDEMVFRFDRRGLSSEFNWEMKEGEAQIRAADPMAHTDASHGLMYAVLRHEIDRKTTRTYRAQNAFGAKVMVTEEKFHDWRLLGGFPIAYWFERDEKISATVDVASEIDDPSKCIMQVTGRLQQPYVVSEYGRVKPTWSDPRDSAVMTTSLLFRVEKLEIIGNKSGRTLYELRPFER